VWNIRGVQKKAESKVRGQLALIHAAEIGRTAIGGPDGSEVTRDFLNVMKQTALTFPTCNQNWAKNHKLAQFTDKIKYEIPLKTGTALTSKIPENVSSWTSEHLIAWLQSIKVRDIDKYIREISNCENGYDGLWVWNRREEPELSELFSLKADLGDVRLALRKWNSNPHQ